MRFLPRISLLNAIAFFLGGTATFSQNVPSNPTFFTGSSPRLVTAGTPNNRVNLPSPRYFFTLQLPADSPESLGKVTIIPQASSNPIVFNLAGTTAFQGTQAQHGQALTVTAHQEKEGAIAIAFDPPIPPGMTFTISLKALQNPPFSGIYQFSVQAFPAGVNPTGMALGVGRLSFLSPW